MPRPEFKLVRGFDVSRRLEAVNCRYLVDRFPLPWLPCILLFLLSPTVMNGAYSDEPIRCVVIDVYYRSDDADHSEFLKALEEFETARGGIILALRDVSTDARDQQRLNAILKHYRVAPTTAPVLYGCNRVINEATPEARWRLQLEEMLQLEVFVRTGCSRCTSAKKWLPTFMKDYPGLKLVLRDLVTDATQVSRMSKLVERHRTAATSVPIFHLCDSLVIGFQKPEFTEAQLRNLLKRWTRDCPQEEAGPPQKEKLKEEEKLKVRSSSAPPRRLSPIVVSAGTRVSQSLTATLLMLNDTAVIGQSRDAVDDTNSVEPDEPSEESALPLPGDDLPIGETGNDTDSALPVTGDAAGDEDFADDQMDVPVFGRLSAGKLGMPLFTIAVGLVDGFNPCAMWVLLFLLSILVNLKDRRRIIAIAGTFVIISGLAYFAFMAAWLNVFMLIGYLRPIQVVLALMAIVIGSIHIKDFFAFRKGISLSIPESAKPGIYARVRSIVTAEHLAGAVAGAVTLAVLVNVVELLCTAGLPALYTNILTQQGYSASVRYAFLGLYILAYMFDDGLMVLIVTWTLSKTKLQESQGRWLKLMSGAAILLLGMVMLFHPELLE